MVNILAADTVTMDISIPRKEAIASFIARQDDSLLASVLEKIERLRGEKFSLTQSEFQALQPLLEPLATHKTIGGSSLNTLSTMQKLLPRKTLNIDFITALGNTAPDQQIKNEMTANGITPLSPADAESGISYIFTEENGNRTIASYRGKCNSTATDSIIAKAGLQKHDWIVFQGSGWREDKFNRSLDELFTKQANSKICLTLPTSAPSEEMPANAYRTLIAHSDLVMGNAEELKRVYETQDIDFALKQLHLAIRQSALITDGANGAFVVTPHDITPIPASAFAKDWIDSQKPIYTLGAGDSAFGGFFAGILSGMKPEEAGKMAMEVAALCMTIPGANLQENSLAPEAADLLTCLKKNIGHACLKQEKASNPYFWQERTSAKTTHWARVA